MIGQLALAFARSTIGRYLMAGLAILAGVGVWSEVKKREGRRAESARRDVETLKTMRRMQDAGNRVPTDRASVARRMRDGSF
jgi:hypothetical protein